MGNNQLAESISPILWNTLAVYVIKETAESMTKYSVTIHSKINMANRLTNKMAIHRTV